LNHFYKRSATSIAYPILPRAAVFILYLILQ